MKNNQPRIICLLTILIIISSSISAYSQTAATRRLYVATAGGFELNEPAANDALKAGADINWQNDAMSGETMLISAIKGFKEAKLIKYLLDHGADASLKDDSGKTALEWAHQYNIGRNRNGKEILSLLEAAGQEEAKPEVETEEPAKRAPADANRTPKTAVQRRRGDKPTEGEIKQMIEQKMTSIYEDHYWGEKNKVEFEWLAPIKIGGQDTKGNIPVSCWVVNIELKVTFTKQSTGETNWVRRGINGKPVKEGFCIWINAYDEWDYLTYAP
jgi:hypothetical protein